MQKTIEVINAMQGAGVIGSYAIGGAMAAIYYTEPTLTDDLDILLSFDAGAPGTTPGSLLTLGPISDYLGNLGYREWRKEGLVVDGWPVQFLPVADQLDREALAQAETVELDIGAGMVVTRVVRAEHLAAIALRTGRAKDFNRILQLLEAGAVGKALLAEVVNRHGLTTSWEQFCRRHNMDAGSHSV